VVVAPAAPPPLLRVVSVTAIVVPAPAVAGAENTETTRSGPTRISAYMALFDSDTSPMASLPSAFANT
jgi:hypothetical protein